MLAYDTSILVMITKNKRIVQFYVIWSNFAMLCSCD